MNKITSFIAVIILVITGVIIVNSFKASASNKITDFDNVFGGSWDLYALPNAGNQDDNWNKPEFKKDGVRLIENQLIGDGGKKYTITTGTQLPVYSSGLGGYRTHTIEGHFVKDMSTGKEDYYTSRGCINNASYCAEADHGMHSGTPGNNSFMRYQMDSPDKNFSALNTCGPQECVFAHRKYANNRYYLKITTYPTNKRDLRQEVVSTVSDNGEILTFVRILNNSNQRIPHIRIGAEITLGSGESYQFTGTGFNGLNIKALDANNNRNLPKFFKPISGATLYASKWDNNNIDDISKNVNSAQCKDVGAVVNQGKARGLYFIADQTSIEASNTLEFSYMTSFKSEKTPDNVVHKTYVDQETGNIFSREDQRGSSCERYEKDIKEIKGYEFINTSGDLASGTFDGEPKNVTYNYKRKTLMATARYVDEKGNVIDTETTIAGKYGERVTLNSKEIDGYRYKRWSGFSASGNGPTAQITILDSTHSSATGKENIVTFHYEKKKEFNVLLNHYLNEGIGGNLKVEEKSFYAEDYYNLNDYLLDISGIKFVKADHEMYFQMPYKSFSITLTYEKITTKILVKFVDDLERKIADDVIYEGKYEKKQKITDKKLTGYFLDPNKTQPALEQVFGFEDKVVTFYYDRQPVTFNVIHKDEKGKVIEQKQVQYKYLDEYDESKILDNKDYIFVKDSNNSTGIVALNQQDIIFEYRKKIETNIKIKYINEKNEILDTLTINGKEGDTYTIPKKDFTGYKFKNSSESLSGVFNDKNKEIVLVYELIDVTITLNYIEEINKDNILAEKILVKGKYGQEYTLPDPKEIDDYIFVRINSKKTGIFKSNMEVSYFYRKPKDSQVKVQYYNDANKKLRDDIIINGKEGQSYQTEQKEFEGHTFKENKGDEPNGVFGIAGKTITYIYSRNEYTITIKHIVEESGEVLSQELKTGKYDTKYTSDYQEFENYILIEIPDNAQGVYKVNNDDVIYKYRLKNYYSINVKHIDDRGQILEKTILKGKEKDRYETKKLEKDGYILIEVDGQANGIFGENIDEIVYHYDRIKTKITFKHLEQIDKKIEPNVIAKDVVLENKYLDEYNHTPQDIQYYDFIEANQKLSGIYGLEDININLIYKRKDAQLKVKYIDDKNQILNEYDINGKQGNEYVTEQKEFDGYIFVKVEGQANGILGESDNEVVYHYDRIKTKITFRHLELIDKKSEANVIAKDVVLENKYLEEYNHIPQEIQYYDFIEANQKLSGIHGLEDININLIYKRKDSQLKVKYIDDKNQILNEYDINGKQGNEYVTEQKEFDGYVFVKVDGQPKGIFQEASQQVVYYYERVSSEVIVNYLGYDNDKLTGEVIEIKEPSIIKGKYLDEYNIKVPTIKNYVYKSSDKNLNGVFKTDNTIINLSYVLKDSEVLVEYVDDRNVQLEKRILKGKIGDTYHSEQLKFEGYNFDFLEGEEKDVFKEEKQHIIYFYDRVKSKVTVKHYGYDSFIMRIAPVIIFDDYILEDKYQNFFSIKPAEIEGYEYVKANQPLDNMYTLEDNVINLMYYHKDAKVNIIYVDDRGNILDEKLLEGKYGEEYQSEPLDFEGYTLMSVSGNAFGKYSDVDENVIYQYERSTSKIIVKHYGYEKNDFSDEPTIIAEDKVYDGRYLDEYKINPASIENYEFKKSDIELEGKYGIESKVIKLKYYHKDSKIIINYIDDKYNKITRNELNGKYGETYRSEPLIFKGYYLVKIQGVTDGIFNTDYEEVTYYYDRTLSVLTIKYIDSKTGKELLKTKLINGKYLDEINIDIPKIKGYTYTGETNLKYVYSINNQEIILKYEEQLAIISTNSLPKTGGYNLLLTYIFMFISLVGIIKIVRNNY